MQSEELIGRVGFVGALYSGGDVAIVQLDVVNRRVGLAAKMAGGRTRPLCQDSPVDEGVKSKVR